MFFYLIFAAMLVVPRGRLLGLVALLGILVGVGMVDRPTSALALTYTSPLLLEFAAGAILRRLLGVQLGRNTLSHQVAGSIAVAVILGVLSFAFPRLLFGPCRSSSSQGVFASSGPVECHGFPGFGWREMPPSRFTFSSSSLSKVSRRFCPSPAAWYFTCQYLTSPLKCRISQARLLSGLSFTSMSRLP